MIAPTDLQENLFRRWYRHGLKLLLAPPPVVKLPWLRYQSLGWSFEDYKAHVRRGLAADIQLELGVISLEEYDERKHHTRNLYAHLGASTLPEHLLDAPTEPRTAMQERQKPVCAAQRRRKARRARR